MPLRPVGSLAGLVTGQGAPEMMEGRRVSSVQGAPGWLFDMGVSKNNGTPKSSILIGFSLINHPFWGVSSIFGLTPI